MKIAIAVLTWNRLPALRVMLSGLQQHCGQYKIAVFEDAGVKDNTVDTIVEGAETELQPRPEYGATYVKSRGVDFFIGRDNLGVAGNSNRALKWFMDESGCDYLCLCNDDLVVKGDFAKFYSEAWEKLKIGLFCFCGFTSKMYAWDPDHIGGYVVKKLGRMTGAMMALPKELVEKIGYFDTRFGKFGEEHCDYTNRARLAGYQELRGTPQVCLDLKHDLLAHSEMQSSMTGTDKVNADTAAANGVKTIDYVADGLYRPYKMFHKVKVGGVDGDGISDTVLGGYYNLVTNAELHR